MSTNEQKKMDVRQTLFGCMKRLDGIKMTIADVIEFLDSERLTLRAPEMTVGDSDSVSEISTDETAGEGIQLVSCICPRCGTTWSEPVSRL